MRRSKSPPKIQLLTHTAMVIPAKRRAEADPETIMVSETTTASEITVAKRGDVRLKLGKAGETTTNVLVSSVVLSLASPVFEAMFNGNFAEGQSLSSHSPREVPLPDDDMESILLICKITHMQIAELAEELSVAAFTTFAIMVDKYQCGKAVQAWSKVWSAAIFQHPPGDDFEKMILATYLLDVPYEFYKTTVILVRDRSKDTQLATMNACLLPVRVFDVLQSNKREAEGQAGAIFHPSVVPSRPCKAYIETSGNLMVNLQKVGIWPTKTQSISELKAKLCKMEGVIKLKCQLWPQACSCPIFPADIKGNAVTRMDQVYRSVKGICLDCIKSHASDGKFQCRIKHDKSGFMEI
jgi:hypothetical protein